MVRNTIIAVVTILLIYFILGYIAAKQEWFEWFDLDTYYGIATIAGGSASVFGLLGLAYGRSSTKDLKNIEADYLRKVADLRDDLDSHEKEVKTKAKDVEELEARKEILELSIKRASKVLFYRNRKKEKEQQIVQILSKDSNGLEILKEINDLDDDLKRLGEEIESDPNVDIIKEILQKEGKIDVESKKNGLFDDLPDNPIIAFFALIFRAFSEYINAITSLVK